jgi:hypothetical protein
MVFLWFSHEKTSIFLWVNPMRIPCFSTIKSRRNATVSPRWSRPLGPCRWWRHHAPGSGLKLFRWKNDGKTYGKICNL